MTTRTITFHFDKSPGSLDLRFLEAHEGVSLIPVNREEISYAVSYIFDRIIARDKALNNAPILSLSAFAVTLSINPQSAQPSLDIDPMKPDEVPITVEKLKKETAELFFKAMKGSRPAASPAASPEDKARDKAEKLRLELENEPKPDSPLPSLSKRLPELEEIEPLSPEDFAPAPQSDLDVKYVEIPAAAAVSQESTSINEGTSAVAIAPPRKPRTQQEMALETLSSLMHAQFFYTETKRTQKPNGEPFGLYLMDRFFGKAKSVSYDVQTQNFILNFETEQKIKLAKLPEGKSSEALATLSKLLDATLFIPKTVKGKFNIDEGQLSFQRGSLRLDWTWTSAQLLGILEGQERDNTIIMQITYLKIPQEGPVNAQDFVDMIECNLPK